MIELLQQNQDIATLIFSAVVALSTVVYAVLTALLVIETRQMRSAQTEPKIVAFVEPREEFINFAHLYFENVGSGPAFDISFEFSAHEDDEGSRILISDFSKSRFLETGVDYIGSGRKIKSRDTGFTTEFDKKIKAIFSITVKYKSSTKRKYCDTYTIDMSQFEGAGDIGTPHMYSIAQSLNKLQEDVRKISSGYNRIQVNSYTHEDRERKKKAVEEYRNEQIAKVETNDENSS